MQQTSNDLVADRPSLDADSGCDPDRPPEERRSKTSKLHWSGIEDATIPNKGLGLQHSQTYRADRAGR